MFKAKSCVLAAGGFESNLEWLREAWGQNENGEWPADNFIIRGTRFNQGNLLKFMIDQGADIIGDPSQSHCVAVDARAPLYDGGICTRIDCVSLGIVVNNKAERFMMKAKTSGQNVMRFGAVLLPNNHSKLLIRLLIQKPLVVLCHLCLQV